MPIKFKFLHAQNIYWYSFIFLFAPFLLFIIFWLKVYLAVLLGILLIYCSYTIYKKIHRQQTNQILFDGNHKNWLIGISIISLWLLFSGVGNVAYQNSDYDIRNAVMRDLVNQEWPVTYKNTIYPPERRFTDNSLLFVYYFGYWLPSALVGKLWGLQAANIALLIWTFIGLVLIYTLLCSYLKSASYKIAILLIAWSGLDIIGTLLAKVTTTKFVELDVLTHIERWGNYFDVHAQFSSNTTLLYWVFNQTIPLWLCILLFLNNKNASYIFFLISLSLFQAPLGTLGFTLYVLIQLLLVIKREGFVNTIHKYLSVPNTIGVLVVLFVTGLFFSMNRAGSMKSIISFDPVYYSVFLTLEIGILGFVLYVYSRRISVLICLAILVLIPFVKIGPFYDFGMRASISYLFIVFVDTVAFLINKKSSSTGSIGKKIILVYVMIGAVTPLLEITRSVLFTGSHVIYLAIEKLKENNMDYLVPDVVQSKIKDRDFAYDKLKTFSKYNKIIEDIVDQYIGESSGNPFADYLLRKNTIDSEDRDSFKAKQ